MPGFYISNYNKNVELKNVCDDLCVKDVFNADGILFKRNTLGKFLNDKVFYNEAEFAVVTEGVILNLSRLLELHKCSDLKALIDKHYLEEECFFQAFRGAFSGCIYNKKKGEIVVWTGHYGDNSVFYCFDKSGEFMVASQVNYILDNIKANGGELSLDKKAVLDTLVFGFMEDNGTYANEIKRLRPGEYLVITLDENKNVVNYTIDKYYILGEKRQTNIEMTETELINELDRLFCNAIKLEYEKDREYGYDHLTDLSGGLDSRMNTMIGHKLGYTNMTNLSYSLSGYLDETIPTKISRDLGNMLVFSPLDDATFMKDIDYITYQNYGLATYVQITGGERMLKSINMNRFGLEHTGQLGDVIIGSFINKQNDTKITGRTGYYSKFSLQKLEEYPIPHSSNKELYLMSSRGMLGTLSSHIIRRNYTEVCSPFLNVELMDFCFSIPIKYRLNHKFYFSWLKQKHPEACEYIWERTGTKPGKRVLFEKPRKFAHRAFWFAARRVGLNKYIKEKNMNPFEQWYKDSLIIKKIWNKYFEENINHVVLSDELKVILTNQFNNGNTMDKMQVLTALSAVKLYFRVGGKM